MSKGTIIENLGEGLYRVQLSYSKERLQGEIVQLSNRLAEIGALIPQRRVELLDLRQRVDDIAGQIDALIPAYVADRGEYQQQMLDLQRSLVGLGADIAQLNRELEDLVAEELSARKRLELLQALPEYKELEAWCADYSLELGGDVGLLDINGEGGGPLIVHPGYDGASEYSIARDGLMVHREAQTGKQLFFNASLLPGVQKWRPRYRLATISTIDGDVCSVVMDEAQSSAQGLNIIEHDTYADVPILYMECDGAVFQEGDRVVVRFTQNGPLVIGFESEPVPCALLRFCFEPSGHIEVGGSESGRVYWGQPLEDQFDDPINPPLGTSYGSNPVWTADPDEDPILIEKARPRNYGNRNWIGPDKTVLSWDGPPNRIFDNNRRFFNPEIGYPHPQWQSRWFASGVIYYDMRVIFRLSDYPEAGLFAYVHGASIYKDQQGVRWLYIIASDDDFAVGQPYGAFRVRIDQENNPVGQLIALETFIPNIDLGHVTHWYFSRDGSKAVCTLRRFSNSNNRSLWGLARYNIETGFTYEVVFDREEVTVGNGTREFSRDYESGSDATGTTTSVDQDYLRTVNRQEYLEPIYCDYVGNREVMVYLRLAKYTESNSYSYDSLFYMNSENQIVDNWKQSSQTITTSEEKPPAIVTSDGQVLLELPAAAKTAFSRDAFEDNIAGTITLTHSSVENYINIQNSHGVMAADARFGFVAVGYIHYQQSITYSGTKAYQPALEEVERYADFSATGSSQRTEEVAIGLGGDLVSVIEVDVNNLPAQTERFFSGQIMPTPDLTPIGGGDENISESFSLKPRSPLVVANHNLLDAFGYHSGAKRVMGFALRDFLLNRNQVLMASDLSGYANVKVDLLGQNGGDLVGLHRVGVF